MSNTRKKLQGGMRINPNTDALVNDGDINVDSSDSKLKVRLGGVDKAVATEDTIASINTITEWTSAGAVTIDAVTTAPTKGTMGVDIQRWRRVGDSMEVHVQMNNTSGGSVGSGDYIYRLPSGYEIDLTKINFQTSTGDDITGGVVGTGRLTNTSSENTASATMCVVSVYDSTGVRLSADDSQETLRNVGSDWFAQTSNSIIDFTYTVPIVGWSSASAFAMAPAQSTLTSWVEYTPTFENLGSGSSATNKAFWRRVGQNMEIQGRFQKDATAGTGGSPVYMSLPSGYTMDTSLVIPTTPLARVGSMYTYNIDTSAQYVTGSVFITTFDTKLQFVDDGTGSAMSGSDFLSNGELAYNISIPIQGWDSTAQFLAAVPLPKVAYCRMKNTDTDVTVGSNTTVTLSSIDGDTEIVSLSSNEFTLNEGKYEIDFVMGMWCNGTGEAVGNCNLYNVTDAQVEAEGTAACGDGTNYGTLAPSIGSATVNFTGSAKTFRIRAQNLRNSGSHTLYVGYGSTSLAADKGYVKIKKIG